MEYAIRKAQFCIKGIVSLIIKTKLWFFWVTEVRKRANSIKIIAISKYSRNKIYLYEEATFLLLEIDFLMK